MILEEDGQVVEATLLEWLLILFPAETVFTYVLRFEMGSISCSFFVLFS